MAIKTREEFIAQLNAFIGENDSDEALSLMEDFTDTYDSLGNETDNENWKEKYEQNDKAWREKYRSRFINGSPDDENDEEDDNNDTRKTPKTFEDLFTEGD